MPLHAKITMKHICKLRDKMYLGKEHAAFLKLQKPVSFSSGFADIQRVVETAQTLTKQMLADYPNKFEVNYDELTGNTQINKLPKVFCEDILNFLGLKYNPLTNNLRKTGGTG